VPDGVQELGLNLYPASLVKPALRGIGAPQSQELHAVLVGAGLPVACRPSSPDWMGLVRRVQTRLDQDGIYDEKDPSLLSMRLSWRFARRARGVLPSSFQDAVAKELQAIWPEPLDELPSDPAFQTVATSFAAFLEATGCNLVLDLNYNPSVELSLRHARIPFVRVVGSEMHQVATVPPGRLLLWKVHGAIDAPSTIVLSPTEYQRMYEVNALGLDLSRLGNNLRRVWAVGVGLRDDDVWAYLCAGATNPEVVALWMTPASADTLDARARADLAPWASIVTSERRSVTVLAAELPAVPPAADTPPLLATCLDGIAAELLRGHRRAPAQQGLLSSPICERSKAFDDAYQGALRTGSTAALRATVDDARRDYHAIRNFLLSFQAGGLGSRWLPSVRPGRGLDLPVPDHLAADLREVMLRANEVFLGRPRGSSGDGILVAAAAQAAVAHAVDLAEVLEIDVVASPSPVHNIFVRDGGRLLVGADPFADPLDECLNPMHTFVFNRAFDLDLTRLGVDPPTSGPLLSEDEWEAALVVAYEQTPRIAVGGVTIDLSVPPLYPWGFRFLDIRRWRAVHPGRVSREWQLVDTHLDDGRQVCKGGSVRDRKPRSFRLAYRGFMRKGEYDELVKAAYRA
jgi:hypothetical protein